ncbi:ASCH domain-containing protein [Solibacillus sp. FSL W7-1464]|uniref:ASCH domain-containing protein n=1 Tax=Solibacillus sp. FSL W7-1464 TaxID=2921706 RepID=UPI0030FA0CFD
MNQIEAYWQYFCNSEGMKNIHYKEAFQFGEKADWLAGLVLDGVKGATCSSFPLYELEGERLPEIGDYQIVLNSQDDPVAIIQSYSIEIYPFNEVPVDFALAEGEGTYAEWKEAHVAFFSRELSEQGLEFTEEMLTVCDRFKKVFPK